MVGHLVDDRVLRPRLDAVLVIFRISLGHLLEPFDEAMLNLSHDKVQLCPIWNKFSLVILSNSVYQVDFLWANR